MPRYFFNVTDNGAVIADREGHELADDELARQDALKVLGERAKDELPDGDHRMFVVEVLNHARALVLTANLSLMVTYPKNRPPANSWKR